MRHWKWVILQSIYEKKPMEPVIAEIAKNEGNDNSVSWAWDQLLSGKNYDSPLLCCTLWEHTHYRSTKLWEAWKDALPASDVRGQLAYCAMSYMTSPLAIAAMWYSTSHHRDKNRLLCATIERFRGFPMVRSHLDLDDYHTIRKLLRGFSQEEILGGKDEPYGDQTYADVIIKNQKGAAELVSGPDL